MTHLHPFKAKLRPFVALAPALALAAAVGRPALAAHDPSGVSPEPEAPITGAPESLEFTSTAPESNAERRMDAHLLETTPRASADDLLRLVPGLLITRHGA
jgi:hypothetical protein